MNNKKYLPILLTIFISSCINTSLAPDVVNRSDAQKEAWR